MILQYSNVLYINKAAFNIFDLVGSTFKKPTLVEILKSVQSAAYIQRTLEAVAALQGRADMAAAAAVKPYMSRKRWAQQQPWQLWAGAADLEATGQ